MQEQKTRRMTYKELDEYLLKGKGVCIWNDVVALTEISYNYEESNEEVPELLKICNLNEIPWKEPMIEV